VSGALYPWIVNGSYQAIPGQSLLDTANLFPDYSQHVGPVTEQIVQANYLLVPQANPKAPYAQQWSFSIQRELDARTTLEINYVGTKGTHLFNRILLSQPSPPADPQNPTLPASRLLYPNLPESFVIEDGFNGPSNYNGMNIKLEHRAANFFLLAAYTWAKSMDIKSAASDIAGDAGTGTPMNTYDLAADYGPSSYDATRRFVASGVYALPFGKGKQFISNVNKTTDLFVGGWQLNGIALFQTGLPYSIFGFDAGGCLGTFSERASIVGNPILQAFIALRVSGSTRPHLSFPQPATLAPQGETQCGRQEEIISTCPFSKTWQSGSVYRFSFDWSLLTRSTIRNSGYPTIRFPTPLLAPFHQHNRPELTNSGRS
jgi:hypothetical protein